MSEAQIVDLRDMLYALSAVIVDAYDALQEIDQTTFEPSGDFSHFFDEKERELLS